MAREGDLAAAAKDDFPEPVAPVVEPEPVRLASVPTLQFTGPDTAIARWENTVEVSTGPSVDRSPQPNIMRIKVKTGTQRRNLKTTLMNRPFLTVVVAQDTSRSSGSAVR